MLHPLPPPAPAQRPSCHFMIIGFITVETAPYNPLRKTITYGIPQVEPPTVFPLRKTATYSIPQVGFR